ncbi:hypothetical protein RhiJN_24946 [Ceratobasidium sp. AG-Ba]|nr:hypothetical protein RhiJN_24946 [Ceratobasidium sp. AG-Ba]
MSSKWEELGLAPPIALKNMYESAKPNHDTNKRGPKPQQEQSRGAVKLTSLAGAVFNHKDNKKDQKDTYKNWFEHKYGYRVSFPDTSNTRYGSHCAAAIELLIHRSSYLDFCLVVRDAKNSATFTNIEKNLYDGLRDQATLTELAVLALYAQAIGAPYMSRVRSDVQNALSLGVFHEQVKNRCRSIINNPNLLLDPSLPPGAGTLDGRPWGRPDVIYCIISMVNELPDLAQMLLVFFSGALEGWERFTLEYAPDGVIAQIGPELRSNGHNTATNDASEGALGQCRQMLRHKPTITDNQQNGRVMWSHNDTHEFVQTHFTAEDHAFVLREARRIDQEGTTRQIHEELNNSLIERATANQEKRAKAIEKRSANEKRLEGVQILQGASEIQLEKLTVRELDQQIDKLRKTDDQLPVKSKIGNKKAKAKAVWEALKRLRAVVQAGTSGEGEVSMTDEFNPVKPTDRGIPQDEDMFYPNEVPICV